VNGDRVAALDELLTRFEDAGCTYVTCWCPPPSTLPAACTADGECVGVAAE
jgi:hypothetical protein